MTYFNEKKMQTMATTWTKTFIMKSTRFISHLEDKRQMNSTSRRPEELDDGDDRRRSKPVQKATFCKWSHLRSCTDRRRRQTDNTAVTKPTL